VESGGDGDKKGTPDADIRTGPSAEAIDYDAGVRRIWSDRASWPTTLQPEPWLAERARIEVEKISSWAGAEGCFQDLCKHGCHPYILGLLLFILRRSRDVEAALARFTDSGKKREAHARRLDDAAALIERLFRRLPAEANAVVDAIFMKAGRTPPAQQALDLRQTAQLVRQCSSLSRRNVAQVSTYLLSAYVEKTAGGPRDAMVSALIAAVRNVPYDEVAHRKWRARNMEKMSQGAIGDWHVLEFLIGLNKLLPPSIGA
jgi:hypothetical protein